MVYKVCAWLNRRYARMLEELQEELGIPSISEIIRMALEALYEARRAQRVYTK